MTRDDFDWDKSTWTRDYSQDFETFKQKLLDCMEIIYPDFTLEWILFVDASDVACGWVLVQLRPQPNGSFITEPLAIGSEKFSTPAAKWHINEKEAYALLRGLQSNHHLVAMKPIYVATDHFNLASNEHANNKKITGYKQQWACYAFKGLLTLKGDQNVADFPTRAGVARDQEVDDVDTNRFQLNFIAARAAGAFDLETRASPKRFTFFIDDQAYFTGNLTNVRCQASKPDGTQCKNRTVIGAAICWVHLLRKHNLAIRDSQYGKGLYAVDTKVNAQLQPKPIVFKKGAKVIEYLGEEVKAAVLEDRYGSKTAPYAMAKHKGLYVDAALLRGVGSLANHSPKPNCRAGLTNRNTITITAYKNIRHGEEVTLNYNNQSADKQSRYQFNEPTNHSTNAIGTQLPQPTPQRTPIEQVQYTPQQQEKAFRESHCDKGVCYGRTKTVSRLFRFFPGHGLSVNQVIDRILDCVECQKYRWANPELKLKAEIKVIEFEDPYTTISIDGIPMSPADIHGYNHIHIVKNHGTGRVTLTAHKSKTDEEACDAIFLYRIRNGNVTVLVSDRGSDYTANLVNKFNELVGIQHRLAITARPQTTGIEPVVGVIKRFIRALAHHQRFVNRWSEPRVLALAEMLFNDDVKEPKKVSPNELTFGTQNPELRQLIYPVEGQTQLTDSEYLDVLKGDLREIRILYEAAKFDQQSKRLEKNAHFLPNRLQKGDFVLYHKATGAKSNTFQPPSPGPFVVKEQRGNTIVAHRFDETADVNIHVDNATVFVGTERQARDLAMRDTDEFVVTAITGWRGNPDSTNTLLFCVTYADGSRLWQPVGGKAADISNTQIFTNYCAGKPMLSPLLYTKSDGSTPRVAANASPILLQPGQAVFVNLRYLSHTLYQFSEYDLDNKYEIDYLIPASVQAITKTKARITIPLTDHVISPNKFDIQRYVTSVATPPAVIVDAALLRKHQCILKLQLPHDWDALSTQDTIELMDSHTEPVLNTINETPNPFESALSLPLETVEPNDEATTPAVLPSDDEDDESDHQDWNDVYHNGDTSTDASSVASSWQSDTPSLRDFEDFHEYPSPNDLFDEAGMQALLEVEHLHSILPPCRLKDNEHYTPNLQGIGGIPPQDLDSMTSENL